MINFKEIKGGTFADKKNLSEAQKILNILLETNVFKEEFFSIPFNKFIIDHEVFEVIQNMNNSFNVVFKEFHSGSRAIAQYRDNVITINTFYWEKMPLHKRASILIHEVLHGLGYKHEDSRDFGSVPYALGNRVEKIIRNHGNEILAGYDRRCYRPWWALFLIKVCHWYKT